MGRASLTAATISSSYLRFGSESCPPLNLWRATDCDDSTEGSANMTVRLQRFAKHVSLQNIIPLCLHRCSSFIRMMLRGYLALRWSTIYSAKELEQHTRELKQLKTTLLFISISSSYIQVSRLNPEAEGAAAPPRGYRLSLSSCLVDMANSRSTRALQFNNTLPCA